MTEREARKQKEWGGLDTDAVQISRGCKIEALFLPDSRRQVEVKLDLGKRSLAVFCSVPMSLC